jgi:hypothetical protein
MTTHILLDLHGYIDPWINTYLVHDLYLKSMDDHLLMIDCLNLSYKIFFFCINLLPRVDTLGVAMGCFPI